MTEQRKPAAARDAIFKAYSEARQARVQREDIWRKTAALCLPRHYPYWLNMATGRSPSERVTLRAYDPIGLIVTQKQTARYRQALAPRGTQWHTLKPVNTELLSRKDVRDYLSGLTHALNNARYAASAGFESALNEFLWSFVAYGTGVLFVGSHTRDGQAGIFYRPCLLRNFYLETNDVDEITATFHRFYLTPRQFEQRFPNAPLPQDAQGMTGDQEAPFEVVHYCYRRAEGDYDRQAIGSNRYPIGSLYFIPKQHTREGGEILSAYRSGFARFPYIVARSLLTPGDAYGHSVLEQLLNVIALVNAIRKSQLKQAQRAVDQVLLAASESLLSDRPDLQAGAINFGAITAEGQRLIDTLDPGNCTIPADLIETMSASIQLALGISPQETKRMTVPEVLENRAERADALSLVFPSLESGLVDPMIRRELELLDTLNLLPQDAPEELEELSGFHVELTSAMARSAHTQEVSGFSRSLELFSLYAQATQDQLVYDHYAIDKVLPEVSESLGMPPRWLTSAEDRRTIRAARNEAADVETGVAAAPALVSLAEMVKPPD